MVPGQPMTIVREIVCEDGDADCEKAPVKDFLGDALKVEKIKRTQITAVGIRWI